MKTQSNIKPLAKFEIEEHGDSAEVIFYCNVEEADGIFTYDEYRVSIPAREGLFEKVEKSYDDWLAFARAEQSKEKPLTEREKIEKLAHENELVGAALTELIITVMGGE